MDMDKAQQEEMQEKIKNMSPEELKQFQKQQCIFCHIISGKAQAKKVYEDEKCLAILDIKPANPGHMLLMPKEHYSIMPLMPAEEISHLFQVAKHLSKACLTAFKKEGSEGDIGTTIFVANGAVAGQHAPHFMLHIIPRKENDGVKGLDFEEKQITANDLKELKRRLAPKAKEHLGSADEPEDEKGAGEKDAGEKGAAKGTNERPAATPRQPARQQDEPRGKRQKEEENRQQEAQNLEGTKLKREDKNTEAAKENAPARQLPKEEAFVEAEFEELSKKTEPKPKKKDEPKDGGVSLDDIAKVLF